MGRGRKIGFIPGPDARYEKTTKEYLDTMGFREAKKIKDGTWLYVDCFGKVLRVREQDGKLYLLHVNPSKTKAGYLQVGAEGGKAINVHTLVAAAFIGPKPEGKEVDHLDKNKENNYYKNLRYVTRKENMQNVDYSVSHNDYGRYRWTRGEFRTQDGDIVPMTRDEYYDHLVITRGKGIANKIFKQHEGVYGF